MPLEPAGAVELARKNLNRWETHHADAWKIERYLRSTQPLPKLPDSATDEYKGLQKRSPSPWALRLVSAVSDQLYVEGYRRTEDPEDAEPWGVWQANRMDARQSIVHDDALTHGESYTLTSPGEPSPVITPLGYRNTLAVYEDRRRDEWPRFVLTRNNVTDPDGKAAVQWQLIDDEAIYSFPASGNKRTLDEPDIVEHEAGRCPVVRFVNIMDAYGHSWGEIELVATVIDRLNQDTFDRLVVQRFGAWKVRWATGMADPTLDEELTDEQQLAVARAQERMLAIGDVLINESEAGKFGTLAETPLTGFLEAYEQDTKTLAALSDVPPHYLLGDLVNLSAESLAAAEAGLTRKATKRKFSFGESWEQNLRLTAHIGGDDKAAEDFAAQVRWRDMESRSLAQAADALGKMATMLGLPAELLWEKVPGLSQQDVERAKQLVREGDAFTAALRDIMDQTRDSGDGQDGQ